MATASRPSRSRSSRGSAALELFFDLVFVFAITQVTGVRLGRPEWTRLVEGMAILAALWWAWEAYVWLGNTAGSDEGTVRVVAAVGDGRDARRLAGRPARVRRGRG